LCKYKAGKKRLFASPVTASFPQLDDQYRIVSNGTPTIAASVNIICWLCGDAASRPVHRAQVPTFFTAAGIRQNRRRIMLTFQRFRPYFSRRAENRLGGQEECFQDRVRA
jgi:hypothetical protein